MKTLAFEITEQLTRQSEPGYLEYLTTNHLPYWRTPDWYFQSVSGGLGPLGVQKGFDELMKMGITDRVPRLAIIQAEGCSPMVSAWQKGLDVAEPISSPRTHITTLATGDPGRTYTLLTRRMHCSVGGAFERVTDEETFRTIHILAKMEGISVEPAAAVAFAGLIKMVRAGTIKSSDVIVINCTGHTMPIEKMILGDGWLQNVSLPAAFADIPQEGLLAAFNRISADRYPTILIVDDLPDARRLVRRILHSQGDFEILEASSGREAIGISQSEHPDLIILDLMMPEIDGFAVLDALKANPDTAQIPVIVVTAKELTTEENELLKGRIHALMQKGQFMSDEFMEEINSLVG